MFNPFDTGAGEYDAWFTENEALFRSERDAVAMLYKGARPSCEIGAGTGVFADAFNVDTGIEPSKAMAEFARKRGISILEGVADALPLSDASQKAALMITVECFLPDCAAAFREVFRVLTDDGEFILAFLNKDTELGKVYEQFKDDDKNYRYATFHTADEILELITGAGFTLADSAQTVFTLDNVYQAPEPGYGKGVFTVFRCVKKNYDE